MYDYDVIFCTNMIMNIYDIIQYQCVNMIGMIGMIDMYIRYNESDTGMNPYDGMPKRIE